MHASVDHSNGLENGLIPADDRSGYHTVSSSVKAVKSVASASNLSTENGTSENLSTVGFRSRHRKQDSVKQRQDRQLYTRKRDNITDTSSTSRTDDEVRSLLDDNSASTQQWLKLSRQQGQVPPQILDELHQLPPAAADTGSALEVLVASYSDSDVASSIREEIQAAVSAANAANHADHPFVSGTAQGYKRIGWARQFGILSRRTWRNLYRNPMLMLTHYAMAISLAVLSGFLFYGLTDDIKGFQNRLGLFFFVLALFGFSTLTSLGVFASERLLFLRERANGYYSPITYFAARVFFDIVPLRLIPPILMGCIVYPMVGLVPSWPEFFKFLVIIVLFNLAAAAVCLFIGIVFEDTSVANLIGSLVMLFSLLFAGLLLNHNAIPKAALWLQNLSIFHYGFEALIVNEVKYLTLVDHKYGLDIEVPGASILSSFGFDVLALWNDVIGLAIFSGAFIMFAYGAMHLLLIEKR